MISEDMQALIGLQAAHARLGLVLPVDNWLVGVDRGDPALSMIYVIRDYELASQKLGGVVLPNTTFYVVKRKWFPWLYRTRYLNWVLTPVPADYVARVAAPVYICKIGVLSDEIAM